MPAIEKTSKQPLTQETRYVVAEWQYQVCEKIYKERPIARKAFHLSVVALDYMLMVPYDTLGFQIHSDNAQLIAILCIHRAAGIVKASGTFKTRPRFDALLKFVKGSVAPSLAYGLWEKVQVALKPLPTDFLLSTDVFLKWNESLEEGSAVSNLALVLLDSYILDYPSLKHPPQRMAAAALAVAMKLIHRNEEKNWLPRHESLSEMKLEEFRGTYDEYFYVAYLLFKDPPEGSPSNDRVEEMEIPLEDNE